MVQRQSVAVVYGRRIGAVDVVNHHRVACLATRFCCTALCEGTLSEAIEHRVRLDLLLDDI